MVAHPSVRSAHEAASTAGDAAPGGRHASVQVGDVLTFDLTVAEIGQDGKIWVRLPLAHNRSHYSFVDPAAATGHMIRAPRQLSVTEVAKTIAAGLAKRGVYFTTNDDIDAIAGDIARVSDGALLRHDAAPDAASGLNKEPGA